MILILGGTTEGYGLAQRLADDGRTDVISSLAGRTANPRLPAGKVRIGGFGGVEGLHAYIRQNHIAALIDATHPFAARMGWNAAQAAQSANIPILRLTRPAWTPGPGDRWCQVENWEQAAAAVAQRGPRVLMTIGRQELDHFSALTDHWFLVRSVDAPDPRPALARMEILLARGPFSLDGERQLLTQHRIDTIVCKNSGGSATDAKLTAARELGLAVVMLQRPPRPDTATAATVEQAATWVADLQQEHPSNGSV